MFKLEMRTRRLMNELATLLNKTSATVTGLQVRRGKLLWLPDVFGYTAALPQILRKAGSTTL